MLIFHFRAGKENERIDLLMRVKPSGEIEDVSLESVEFSKLALPNPISKEKQRRGRSQRGDAITDLAYWEGKVYIAGLSNEEFASALQVVPFPFEQETSSTSIEIYHAAHGQFETHAPIRTFLPYALNDEPHVLASYTCTPASNVSR